MPVEQLTGKVEATVPAYVEVWIREMCEESGLSIASVVRMLLIKARRAASELVA